MSEYKRLKPFRKGLFNAIVRPAKGKNEPKSVNLAIDYESIVNPLHFEQAAERGLKLLNRSSNRTYGFFEKPCGHTAFLHYGAVRKSRGKHQCPECVVEGYDTAAARVNFKLMAKAGNSGIYRCNECGKDSLLCNSNIVKCTQDKFSCKYCRHDGYVLEASRLGLNLLSFDCDSNWRRLYLLPCGHTKMISAAAVKDVAFRCRDCQNAKYHEDAKIAGIEYLQHIKSSHHDYRVYKLSCGCIKELAIACVKNNSFECKLHSNRTIDYSVPIYVYLVKIQLNGFSVLKIGFTMDIHGKSTRFARYGVNRGMVTEIGIASFSNGEDAVAFERYIHAKYKTMSVGKDLLKPQMRNGFTECYPMYMLDTLKQEIEDKRKELSAK